VYWWQLFDVGKLMPNGAYHFFIVRLEDQFDSLNVNDGEAAVNEFEIEDYIDPSMLGIYISLLHRLCFLLFSYNIYLIREYILPKHHVVVVLIL
jgi:hypothetical protein